MAFRPPGINLSHHVRDFHPGEVIVADHAAGTSASDTLGSTAVLVPRDQRQGIVPDDMRMELGKVERVGCADSWILRIEVVTVGCYGFWVDGDNHIFVLAATGATWVRALVATRVDTGEGYIDTGGYEGMAIHNCSVGAIFSRGGRYGGSVLVTEITAGSAHWPVEEGCCGWEIMAVGTGILHCVVPFYRGALCWADGAVCVSWNFRCY